MQKNHRENIQPLKESGGKNGQEQELEQTSL
jgi:hypothetical protein